jgi:hypothetical protein
MATLKDAMGRIENHEKECALRYSNIEKQLDDGKKRFDKLEGLIWAIYPFILLTLAFTKWL